MITPVYQYKIAKKMAGCVCLKNHSNLKDFFTFLVRYFVATVDNIHTGYKNQNIGQKNKRQLYMP
jgi:hypothetical protein